MAKILTVVGARPQFIKAAMLSRLLRDDDRLEEVLLHTGQHYDHGMSDVFFEEMQIPQPKYNLGVGGGTQGAMTGRQLEGIEKVLLDEKPDCLVVYGDTNSTLAGALAAAKLHIPVAHVEAGLRSFNMRMPEEVNRILTDRVSRWLFTPSNTANDNLAAEGVTKGVQFVGDIMFDAARFYGAQVEAEGAKIVDDLGLAGRDYRLATVHRQENVVGPERLGAILSAFRELSGDCPMVLPLHPRLRAMLERNGTYDAATKGITVIDPVGFKDMIALLRGARIVATDSGGVQKEAYFHGARAIVLRDETEWVELVDLGLADLCKPSDAAAVVNAVREGEAKALDLTQKPYGDGTTAEAIRDALREAL